MSIAALIAALAAWITPIAALADDVRIDDANDTRGRLDIRSAEAVHSSNGLIYTVTTYDRFNAIDPRVEAIAVGFDTDGDGSDFERILFFYSTPTSTGVSWHGAMTNGNGRRLLSRVPVEHPSRTSVEARLATEKIGRNLSGYRWVAYTITDERGDCCIDTAPNRRWVLHDLAAPVVDDLDLGIVEGQSVASTEVTATFAVADAGGSGISQWELKTRVNGTSEWTTVTTGSSGGRQSVSFTGLQGVAYDVCVRAEDRSGNVTNDAFSHVEIPFDDMSSIFSFDGSWTVETSNPDDFMGTRHVGSEGAELVINVPANVEIDLIVPPGYDGAARAEISTGFSTGIGIDTITVPRTIYPTHLGGPYAEPTTILLRVDMGTFAIDGLLGAPPHVPPPFGQASCP